MQTSEWLNTTLSYSSFASSNNEKTKSESIVMPILVELIKENNDFITYFSGSNLDVDKEKELNGECDFIITKNNGSIRVKAPIFQITEAKDDNMKLGISQCAAQMYAADLFNKKNGEDIDYIYGCVKTGNDWLFMKLCEKKLFVDKQIYYLNETDKILGVLQNIINTFK